MATPTELLDEAKCFDCIPNGMQGPVSIYLLMVNAGLDMTPAQLIDAAKCFTCIPPGFQAAVQTYLLDQIVINGGGGGGGGSGVTCSPSSTPSGVPTGNCGLWIQLSTGKMWVWNSGDTNWDPLLG